MSSSTSEEEYEKAGWGSSAKYTPPDDTPNGQKDLAASVDKLVIVKDEEIGMIPDLKHLYGGKEDKRGRFTWQVKHFGLLRFLQLTSSLHAEQAGQATRRYWQTERRRRHSQACHHRQVHQGVR
jgi:hypothetical protein